MASVAERSLTTVHFQSFLFGLDSASLSVKSVAWSGTVFSSHQRDKPAPCTSSSTLPAWPSALSATTFLSLAQCESFFWCVDGAYIKGRSYDSRSSRASRCCGSTTPSSDPGGKCHRSDGPGWFAHNTPWRGRRLPQCFGFVLLYDRMGRHVSGCLLGIFPTARSANR